MLSIVLTWVTLLLASYTLAQTTTSCNPTEKTCSSDTALSSSTYTHDFTQGADDSNWNVTAGNVSYTSSGAVFTISEAGDAPTIQSNWYIFFGQVSFHVLASPGTGIVSCAILQSSDLDEIDWEWLGGTDNAVQTDYFGKGNTTKADREVDATVDNAQITSHNYTVRWTQQTTTWLIDGEVVRTLEYADAVGGSNYPQTPMNIRVGIWAGGDSGNDEGTIDWAGGETDYSDGPFTMVLEKIEVVNYNPGKSYVYGNMSGEWESIEIQGGNDGEDGDTTAESTQIGTAVTGSEQTSTATGMWWTASASAIIAQAKSSGAAMEGGSWWNVLELVAVSLFVGL